MKNTLRIGHEITNLTEPQIMGILNITPDSFYKYSRINPNDEVILEKAEKMIKEGVNIFDIGGLSARPGSKVISHREEIERVVPAINILKNNFPNIPISVDTFRAKVAYEAIKNGATIINDISGGDFDPDMFTLVTEKKPTYIMMHLQGDFSEIHHNTNYSDFFPNILNKLFIKANFLRKNGVPDIIIDPGFGFSKTIEGNYEMLKHFELFHTEIYPVLAGISRKSMIYKSLNLTPEEVLIPTVAFQAYTILKKAKIIRVHDIKPIKEVVKLLNTFRFLDS